MKIKVIEYVGEIGKIGEFLNYEFTIDLNAPDFSEQFDKERKKALKKHLEMKRRIISNVYEEIAKN